MKYGKGYTVRSHFITTETTENLIKKYAVENDISYNDALNRIVELGLKLRRPIPKKYEINDQKIRKSLSEIIDVTSKIGTENDVQDVFEEVGFIRNSLSQILDILNKKGLNK